MAQVQYAGGSGVPVLPSNLPGIPQGGYGDPGINPNASQRPSLWDDILNVFLGDLRGQRPSEPVTPAEAEKNRQAASEARKVLIDQTGDSGKGVLQGGPGFCLGADKEICKDAGAFSGLCSFASNLTCLFIGLTILLALLGLGVHGILK